MILLENFINFMFRNVWCFIGCFLILAIVLETIEKMWVSFFNFLTQLFSNKIKNNFYISEKNVNEKFIKELEKYGCKKGKSTD